MNGKPVSGLTVDQVRAIGYDLGRRGVPAPAPGVRTTLAKRRAYIEGWRAGRDEREAA
jgi:hypothetical protein